MPHFDNHRGTESHLFIVTSLVPAILFLATLVAAVHVSRAEPVATESGVAGYSVSMNVTA